jgi:hypothetical protein
LRKLETGAFIDGRKDVSFEKSKNCFPKGAPSFLSWCIGFYQSCCLASAEKKREGGKRESELNLAIWHKTPGSSSRQLPLI